MSLYQKLKIKNSSRHTALSQSEAEFLYDFIKKNKIIKTLEIGLAFGCSAAHIMSATNNIHYAIDPFQNSHRYENLGIKNIQKIKLDHNLKFFPRHSAQVLPELSSKNLEFDLIFHDGSHKFDDIFVDFYFADTMVPIDRYVIFHDAATPSMQILASWIANNKKNYQLIESPQPNFLIYQKTGQDERKWHEFIPFGAIKTNRISF